MKFFIKNCFVFVLLASGSLAFAKEKVDRLRYGGFGEAPLTAAEARKILKKNNAEALATAQAKVEAAKTPREKKKAMAELKFLKANISHYEKVRREKKMAKKKFSISPSDRKTEATGVKVPCPHCDSTSTEVSLTDDTNCNNPSLPEDRRCDAISKSSQDSQDTSGVR